MRKFNMACRHFAVMATYAAMPAAHRELLELADRFYVRAKAVGLSNLEASEFLQVRVDKAASCPHTTLYGAYQTAIADLLEINNG